MPCSSPGWARAVLMSLALPALTGAAPSANRAATGEGAIRALLGAQAEAWNRGDLEGYMAGYWNSPDLVFQSGGTITRGWQPTLERYRKRYTGAGREMGRLEFEGVEVQVLGTDAALARGHWRLEMTDGARPEGLFTLFLRRFGREWRIVHDHTSS